MEKKPIVVIFLRHFACITCRAHARQVWKQRKLYESKGVSIVSLGNGSSEFIQSFKKDLGLQDAVVVAAPSLEAFRAAGFRHGFRYVVQWKTVVDVVKMNRQGHQQVRKEKGAGTHWQLGGVIVVKTDGSISYHYISESMGDFPEEPHFDTIENEEKVLRKQTQKSLY